MLGFLVFVFLYLFMLLAHNSQRKSRSSLVQSLIYAGIVIFVISMFSVVSLGVLLFVLLFAPFFFFPNQRKKRKHSYKFDQDQAFKDFFEQMHRQQRGRSQGSYQEHGYRDYTAEPRNGMSRDEAAKLLGVPINATATQVKSAYRKLMLKHHPDKGGSAEYAAKLNVARDVMMPKSG